MFVHLVCHSVPVPALPVRSGADFSLLITWDNHAGKSGQGEREGDTEGKDDPGQRWELGFA